MRVSSGRFGCLFACVCFLTVTWIKSVPNDGGLPVELPNVHSLHQRLLAAEELGGQVNRELSNILQQLKNLSQAPPQPSSNTTTLTPPDPVQQRKSDVLQNFNKPNLHLYMPHLRQHPHSLLPNVVIGKGRRGVSIVLGIPTVKRVKQSYLVNTLGSLLFDLTHSQRQDLLIIVFVAETDFQYVTSVAETMRTNFPNEVESGLLEVVSPSQYYYPDFTALKETFGDSKDRVKWRTKQNLDFSFLMLYAQDKGTYYVQLEDDVIAKTDYYDAMKSYAVQEASKPWLYLEFSKLGFIGKMFRTRDLPRIVEFFLMFHKDKPIDWLLDHILWVKVCNPEKDTKHCNEQKALLKQSYKPSLFQHVGLHSSLPGKVQQLKDKDFGTQKLFRAHSNPPAQVSSSLKHYQQHSLDRAYRGEDFFWALTPMKGDYILFIFSQPIHITRYLFRSGNIETSSDKFYNTTVEVLPTNVFTLGKSNQTEYTTSSGGFIVIGKFEKGVGEGTIDAALQPISALRLVVQDDSDFWAVLREIFIQV